MSNNQQETRNTMDQSTTTAINNLINKTSTKFDFIKLAMDSLPADKNTMWMHCWRRPEAKSNI